MSVGTRRRREGSAVNNGHGGGSYSYNNQSRGKGKRRGNNFIESEGSETDFDSAHTLSWKFIVVFFTVIISVLHRYHVAFMFESDRHFSHLSDLEREMVFRTEMGLYYSYYKSINAAPTFWRGIFEITHDNVTEFGHTINTLKRFNLYPELILSAMYRMYTGLAEAYNWNTQECWSTNRGDDLEPVLSCEGMGNQFYFYVNHVFALAGSCAGVLFLYGVLLSDSLLGGLLVSAGFFFNHGEATRVQWTPSLRESFAYPIWAGQMLVVSYIIKYKRAGSFWICSVAFLTVCFMLSWQFASFALSTQVGSLFVCYVLDYIDSRTLRTIVYGHSAAFFSGFIFLFGNEMLLSSLFLSSLITVQILLVLESVLTKISLRPLFCTIMFVLFAVGTLGIKLLIGSILSVKDDAHIFAILASKFSNYSNFDTRLYTCAAEFGFMLEETPWKLAKTLLLPSCIFAALLFIVELGKKELPNLLWCSRSTSICKPYSEMLYNFIQLAGYSVMAILIMRLKLFFTPHLCIFTSLLASQQLCKSLFGDRLKLLWHQAFCVAVIGGMAVQGVSNLKIQWDIKGEYSNVPQEQLFNWIVKNTNKYSVFAGSMPTMANVKLSTSRPIVNHPHYEDTGIRLSHFPSSKYCYCPCATWSPAAPKSPKYDLNSSRNHKYSYDSYHRKYPSPRQSYVAPDLSRSHIPYIPPIYVEVPIPGEQARTSNLV